VIGQCWAERICRERPELRAEPEWPTHGPQAVKALAIARRLVRQLTADPRLLEELAAACAAGAAAWWQRRGPAYRESYPLIGAGGSGIQCVGCTTPCSSDDHHP